MRTHPDVQRRLLLGIDIESKHITCGLVDTIGKGNTFDENVVVIECLKRSYTLVKTLEYKAKHGLHSMKDVTIILPTEYEEWFVNALEGYFVACPGECIYLLSFMVNNCGIT